MHAWPARATGFGQALSVFIMHGLGSQPCFGIPQQISCLLQTAILSSALSSNHFAWGLLLPGQYSPEQAVLINLEHIKILANSFQTGLCDSNSTFFFFFNFAMGFPQKSSLQGDYKLFLLRALQDTGHEVHETCDSATFYFMKKDFKRCCDTTMSESIHTKDESKRGTAFAFIFGVN